MIILVCFYLAFAALMLLPFSGVWFMAKRMPGFWRTFTRVAAATLLLTPSWGPATITVVLVPFGLLFFVALFTWSWGELAALMGLFPLWHAIAFPVTALVAYLVLRGRPSNNSFKADGSAAA